jgi:hypothetical protein
MCFRKVRIEIQGFIAGCNDIVQRYFTVHQAPEGVAIGYTCICLGIICVELDRSPEHTVSVLI